jgi:glycosyltransferase involved in cell wall biosynthesis
MQLERQADQAGVRLRYAADRFEPDLEGKPVGPAHTLHDAYLAADLITYPSLYEGYGNALIEAIFYGKPVVVNRYPVYAADIAPLGLRFIELDGAITDAAVAEVRYALANPERQARIAAHNYDIARRRLSYKVLRRRLRRLLGEVTGGVTGG